MKTSLTVCSVVMAVVLSSGPASLAGEGYETAGAVPAGKYLPAELMKGPEWTVAPEAVNDGFDNTYVVESRFGSWQSRGRAQVAARTQEVRAFARLEEVSKSDVFLDAVKRSAIAPLQLVGDVATRPVETLKGIPAGVGRWFKTTSFQVKETYHDVEEAKDKRKAEAAAPGSGPTEPAQKEAKDRALEVSRNYLKVSAAERRWYAELGVDPATDNAKLREAIGSVAKVEGLTSFGMKLVSLPSIPGASEMRTAMKLVWQTDPWELRLRNRKALLAAGISEKTARAFEDNPALSLTQQTVFLDTLAALAGVAGREHLLARALDCKTRGEGEGLTASTVLLLRFHREQAPLAAFLPGTRLPVARTADGRLVAVLIADAMFWTEAVASAAREFAGTYAPEKAAGREVWVVGEASPSLENGVGGLGWKVIDHWQLSAPEDRSDGAGGAR